MALSIFPVIDELRQLKRCFDCEDYCLDVDWYTILETEDDGFYVPLCNKCIDGRCDD